MTAMLQMHSQMDSHLVLEAAVASTTTTAEEVNLVDAKAVKRAVALGEAVVVVVAEVAMRPLLVSVSVMHGTMS